MLNEIRITSLIDFNLNILIITYQDIFEKIKLIVEDWIHSRIAEKESAAMRDSLDGESRILLYLSRRLPTT